MTEVRRDNPFRLPHGSTGQQQPLRPHRFAVEMDYYVKIDRTEEALERFEGEVTVESVVEDGRLVLVTGREGSGKTSLLNQCVAGFCRSVARRGRAGTGPVVPVVVDLVREDPRPPSIPSRATEVCRRIARELHRIARKGNWDGTFSDRIPRIDRKVVLGSAELDEVFLELSDLLVDLEENRIGGYVLVVMLPRCLDAPRSEMENYARWARPRLLFLLESEFYGESQIDVPPSGIPPLVLRVGDLRKSDGWLFVSSRLTHDGETITAPPTVTEATMSQLMEDNISMAQLQQLMYGVFSHVLSTDRPVSEITMNEITHFTYRSWIDSRTRNGGGLS